MTTREDKRRQRNKLIIGLLTIFLMISSVLGIIGYNQQESQNSVGGINFLQKPSNVYGTIWEAKIDGTTYQFNAHPYQLLSFGMNVSIEPLQNAAQVLLTTDAPTLTGNHADFIAAMQYELASALQKQGKEVAQGFTNASGYQVQQITCTDASDETVVIYSVVGNESIIRLQENCYVMSSATQTDHFFLKDRLLYALLGVQI